MKKPKKIISIGAVILSLAAAAGTVAALASAPKGSWAGGVHPGFHRLSCHAGPHGQDIADFLLWKMDRHATELNLNETQLQKYEEIKANIKSSIADAMERRSALHGIVREEMNKENPDVKALANLFKERVQHLPDVVSRHIDLFLSFYDMLDETQQAKVVEHFRWRMGTAQR